MKRKVAHLLTKMIRHQEETKDDFTLWQKTIFLISALEVVISEYTR
jgi:hypothetical protein